VLAVQPATARMVRQQLEAVFAELRPAAVKTGMLYSKPIMQEVARFLREIKRLPLVVDPVMVATSGALLLKPAALRCLQRDLLPLATLITPNLPEAERLTGRRLGSVEDMRAAARWLFERHGCAVLVKGGHLRGSREAADVFFDGREELLLTAPFIQGVSTHGTGCTYAAAIAGHLALGHRLPRAVALAKEFITQAIAQSVRVGRHTVLNPFRR
jgi:hydroxymethylpyrimidine/phosphomethylpyrimidine kinase